MLLLLITSVVRADDGASFSGFIDLGYALNGNDPASRDNFVPGTGTTGKRANEAMINLAQVQWSRATSADHPIGFTLALVAGEGANVVHAGEPDGADHVRHIYQASIAYRLRRGLVIEVGVYPSHIGFEGFYSKDNWNYTRSWLGEFSPYYQTGVKASYAFSDRWSAQVHALNGWQIINDSNDAKAIGTQLAYSSGALTASLNTFVGGEPSSSGDSMRKFGDLVVVYKVTPALQLGASIDVGRQGAAEWRGIAGYARYAINERHVIALRAEHFDDPDSGITAAPQTLREVTATYEMRPHGQLILKLEGRHDRSTAAVFGKGDTLDKRQLLALIGAVVTF